RGWAGQFIFDTHPSVECPIGPLPGSPHHLHWPIGRCRIRRHLYRLEEYCLSTRADDRTASQLREVSIETGWSAHAEGSARVSFGDTQVVCTASFTQGVPRWLKGKNRGWVTAEYAMLPRATGERSARESVRGKVSGRTQEISRLIGRSLRAVVDTKALGETTIVLDCDVIQADGGTRTAAITGAWVALALAIDWAGDQRIIRSSAKPLTGSVAAVSVGIVDGEAVLDLPYAEDVRAETDMNVVTTADGEFIEIQGTAEQQPFNRAQLDELLDLAVAGTAELTQIQQAALAGTVGQE